MFERRDGELFAEGVSLESLAEQYGTPVFIYSRAALESAWREIDSALGSAPHLICYAVKANSNLAVLDVLARLGSGFDIVSGGELKRVLAAGGKPEKCVFSGVGKSVREMEQALEAGIRCFNVESFAELERLASLATAHGVVAPVSFRVNPDVDAQTHPYISTGLKENKFGIPMEEAAEAYQRAAAFPSIEVHGIDFHIGSQLTDIQPYVDTMQRIVQLLDQLADAGVNIQHVDVGGGQGINYDNETPLDIAAWANCITGALAGRGVEILVEPGRYIAGPAGVMLTRVEYLKSNADKRFAVVDAAMNDLIRPALYQAWQAIEPVRQLAREAAVYDVVGPVCESADFLGKERTLEIAAGDLLAVRGSGAYAAVMSSNYNTRPRASEVLVDGEQAHLVRAREEPEALFAREYLLP